MKKALTLTLVMLGVWSLAFAQFNREDPLGGSRRLIEQEEILLFFGETSSANSNVHTAAGRTYSLRDTFVVFPPFPLPGFPQDTIPFVDLVQTSSFVGNSGSAGAHDIPVSDVATGRFFGDDYGDGIIYAYHSESGTGQPVAALRLDLQRTFVGSGGGVALNGPIIATFPDMYVGNATFETPRVVVASGNFLAEAEEEAVLIYPHTNGTYRLAPLSFSLNATATDITPVSHPVVNGPSYDQVVKRIPAGIAATAVDLDMDGQDELALAYEQNDDLFVNIYAADSNDVLTLQSSQKVLDLGLDGCNGQNNPYEFSDLSLALSSGDLNGTFYGEELVLAAHYGIMSGAGSPGSNQGLYILPLQRSDSSFDLIFPTCLDTGAPTYRTGSVFTASDAHFRDQPISLDVGTGDLDGDLDEEIVVGVGSTIRCLDVSKGQDGATNYLRMESMASFTVPETSDPNANNGGEGEYANHWLAVGNIDPIAGIQGDFRAEIVIAKNFHSIIDPSTGEREQSFSLFIWGLDSALNPIERRTETDIALQTSVSDIRHYSLALGDLDGGSVSLGPPRRSTQSEILTPLVVLNAPPSHFDLLGNNAYDLCNLYGPNAPGANISHFSSVYEEVSTEAFSFQTEFSSDWAVSGEVQAGFETPGFSLGAKLRQTYGERFEQLEGSEFTRTVTNQRTAFKDDQLQAYYVDYTVLEYPVYRRGDSVPGTHILVVIPEALREGFDGVRDAGNPYVPAHQHGNLFSYPRSFADLPLARGAQIDTTTFFTQSVSKGSGYENQFSIAWSDAQQAGIAQEQVTETSVGANVGGAFKGFGLSASVEGTYQEAEVQTRVNRYRDSVRMFGIFGEGEQASIPGDYPYRVTPVVYWDAAGTLVLDYLVNISDARDEFWANFYDGYDPAFLLLDPLEPEKGIESGDGYNDAKRYLTRDIRFDRLPRPGGQTTIRARIHNYGFQNTPANVPLTVSFYYLDPSQSDSLHAIGVDTISVGILGRLAGFDQEIAEYTWDIPMGLGLETKVVAIIDEANALPDEIHDYPQGNGVSNNLGWTCLFASTCNPPNGEASWLPVVSPATHIAAVSQPQRLKVGPNPAREQARLYLPMQWRESARLEVVNALGQTVYQSTLQPGQSQMGHLIPCADWQPGVYYLRVSDGQQHGHATLLVEER